MNVRENFLSTEAKMQIAALKKIRLWRTIAIAFSTLGVALTYAGMAGADRNIVCGILGVSLIVISIVCAVVLNLGLKNGRRNVEKILNALEVRTDEV